MRWDDGFVAKTMPGDEPYFKLYNQLYIKLFNVLILNIQYVTVVYNKPYSQPYMTTLA
ncbi:hypothetical protein AWB66_03264 [Caballeronia telluris]|uniref:Uncharacterized protein n=1 Tax=Caballeronia telluris TaxID=326475 RepID=A0A158IMZ5_9BURK|nr:hypothetical protein AWB66_03202 [Caballeronia telluris]SAL58532.1 hypothetical protein AWB66_03264 [Caballeronia telluris]